MTSDVGGIDCPDILCTATFDQPTVVTLTAIPDADHEFDGWTGADAEDCVSVSADVCELTMTQQMDVTATFSMIQHFVTVTVNGNGDVTSDVGGIDCPEVDCAATFDQGSTVTLTATPDADHEFDGWTGDDAGDCVSATPDVCALTVDAAKSVTATFSTIQHLVTVTVVGNGDVTADSGSIDCPDADCDDLYDQGSTVTLTAIPDADHEFDGWSGDNATDCVSVTPDVCALTVDAAKSVTATFSTIQWDLNVTVVGNGVVTGDESGSGDGIDCPDDADEGDCSETFNQGTVVTLTATPDADHEFDGWTGPDADECVSATPDVCVLTMTEQMDVTATFSTIQHFVTVTVNGNGDVISDVGGIDCPEVDCAATFDQGSTVTLTATPDADHEFDGWSGANAADCVSATPDVCALTIDAAKAVTAAFSTIEWDLDVTVFGNGEVSSDVGGINCPNDDDAGDCSDTYDQSTVVTLTADPDTNWEFDGWSGAGAEDCANASNPVCAVTMDEDEEITATFTLVNRTLTVTVNGPGTVADDQVQIACGFDCDGAYPHGTEVTLTATPGLNAQFDGWSGADSEDCVSATPDVCTLTMTEDKAVTATFSLVDRTLTVAISGTGSGSVTDDDDQIDCEGDCTGTYPHGTVVTLTATPADANSEFLQWNNASPCTTSPTCDVTMDADKSVTAIFRPVDRTLTVTVNGTGTGTVTSNYPGIDCPDDADAGDCQAGIPHGTGVTLTATEAPGSDFVGWSGPDAPLSCTSSPTITCSFVMDADKAITATFDLDTPTTGADLRIRKTEVNDPVPVGGNITYWVRVMNSGPDTATNVKMFDQLPANVTFVSFQTEQGTCAYSSSRHLVGCQIGTILDGGFVRIRIVVQAESAGTVSSTATAHSPVEDPNPGNNSETITTSVQNET